MNNGPLLFLGVLVTLATSFWGLILAPQVQFGRQTSRLIEATGEYYPPGRPGLAEKGAEVYRSLGCAECHSQQVRQTGVNFDVWVTELSTNVASIASSLAKLRGGSNAGEWSSQLANLPARVASGLSGADAQALAKQFTDVGAKAEATLVTLGPDIERKWGRRMSVAQDYLRDHPVQLGRLRLGPDLANYGARQTNVSLILKHLYEPASTMPGSIMPPSRFLFERSSYSVGEPLPDRAVILTTAVPDKNGEIIVPTEDGRALLEYLLSLKSETSLYEAPIGNPPAPASAPTITPGAPAQ